MNLIRFRSKVLRFILPVADSLGYFVYSTALTPKFGLGLVGGAFIGTILSAKLSGRIVIEGFNNAPHPLRYILGAFFMAFGGVIAGGCTVGWLLTGGSVLNGGVLIAFIGFGLGNLSLRLPFINGFLNRRNGDQLAFNLILIHHQFDRRKWPPTAT